jgi:hypothetical protein
MTMYEVPRMINLGDLTGNRLAQTVDCTRL